METEFEYIRKKETAKVSKDRETLAEMRETVYLDYTHEFEVHCSTQLEIFNRDTFKVIHDFIIEEKKNTQVINPFKREFMARHPEWREEDLVYSGQDGFIIYWDFAMSLPASYENLRIVYGIYNEGKVIYKPRQVPLAMCSPDPQSSEFEKMCGIGIIHELQNIFPHPSSRLVIEIRTETSEGYFPIASGHISATCENPCPYCRARTHKTPRKHYRKEKYKNYAKKQRAHLSIGSDMIFMFTTDLEAVKSRCSETTSPTSKMTFSFWTQRPPITA